MNKNLVSEMVSNGCKIVFNNNYSTVLDAENTDYTTTNCRYILVESNKIHDSFLSMSDAIDFIESGFTFSEGVIFFNRKECGRYNFSSTRENFEANVWYTGKNGLDMENYEAGTLEKLILNIKKDFGY